MSYRIPTVRIVHATRGCAIINASDFDSKVHVLYDDDPAGEIPPGNYTGVPVLSDAEWKTRDPEDVSDAIEPQKYEAKHRGRGSFSVLHNGVEVVEGLSKMEARAFNEYSPAEQAAFVANRSKR